MIRKAVLAVACAMCLPGAVHAETLSAEVEADLRCLMISFQMVQSDDPKIAQGALISGFYYLGRVDAAAPDLDLEAKLLDAERQFQGRDFAAEVARCAKTLGARGQQLQETGKRVTEVEKSREATKGQKGI